MRVVVVGAGEVGFHLAQRLSEEHQDVVVIDADPEQVEHAAQQLDVQTMRTLGASDASKRGRSSMIDSIVEVPSTMTVPPFGRFGS